MSLVTQHRRFQPAHGLRSRRVSYGAPVGIGDPRPIAGDVNFRVVDRPDIDLAGTMSGLDQLRKLHAIEPLAIVEGVEVRRQNLLEEVAVVVARGLE